MSESGELMRALLRDHLDLRARKQRGDEVPGAAEVVPTRRDSGTAGAG